MRTHLAALLALAALPLVAVPAAAQGISMFTAEARAGLAFPVDDFAARGEVGALVEGTLRFAPLPFVAAYAGYSLADFGIDSGASMAGLDMRLRDTGVRAGAELSVPLAGLLSGVAPYAHAGLLFNRARIRVEGDGTNTLSVKSDRSRGHEVGIGARVKLRRHLAIVPELRYRRYDPEYPDGPSGGSGGPVSYLSAGIGISAHF